MSGFETALQFIVDGLTAIVQFVVTLGGLFGPYS
jgi:hypothetical protein